MASSDPESGRANARWANIASDDNYATRVDSKWTPWLIPVFVVANVAVFIVVMYFNNCPANNQDLNGNCVAGFLSRFSFQPLRENPLFGPSSATLEKLGALQRYKVVQEHQGWRLVSCFWLNAGFIHLLLNMLSLVIIGVRLEQQFGFVRVGILYLVSGFGGSILSSLFIQNYVTVGASGGLFGLLGATLSELMTSQAAYSHKTAALFTVIVIAAINLAVGIFPHVNNFASIGGFITGLLLGFALLLRAQHGWVESKQYLPPGAQVQSKYKLYQYALCLVSLLLLIAGFAVGLVMLFKGKIGNKHQLGNKHCSWCHYLSCVPTSKWNCDS